MNMAMCISYAEENVYLYGMFLGLPVVHIYLDTQICMVEIPDAVLLPLNPEDQDKWVHKKRVCGIASCLKQLAMWKVLKWLHIWASPTPIPLTSGKQCWQDLFVIVLTLLSHQMSHEICEVKIKNLQ